MKSRSDLNTGIVSDDEDYDPKLFTREPKLREEFYYQRIPRVGDSKMQPYLKCVNKALEIGYIKNRCPKNVERDDEYTSRGWGQFPKGHDFVTNEAMKWLGSLPTIKGPLKIGNMCYVRISNEWDPVNPDDYVRLGKIIQLTEHKWTSGHTVKVRVLDKRGIWDEETFHCDTIIQVDINEKLLISYIFYLREELAEQYSSGPMHLNGAINLALGYYDIRAIEKLLSFDTKTDPYKDAPAGRFARWSFLRKQLRDQACELRRKIKKLEPKSDEDKSPEWIEVDMRLKEMNDRHDNIKFLMLHRADIEREVRSFERMTTRRSFVFGDVTLMMSTQARKWVGITHTIPDGKLHNQWATLFKLLEQIVPQDVYPSVNAFFIPDDIYMKFDFQFDEIHFKKGDVWFTDYGFPKLEPNMKKAKSSRRTPPKAWNYKPQPSQSSSGAEIIQDLQEQLIAMRAKNIDVQKQLTAMRNQHNEVKEQLCDKKIELMMANSELSDMLALHQVIEDNHEKTITAMQAHIVELVSGKAFYEDEHDKISDELAKLQRKVAELEKSHAEEKSDISDTKDKSEMQFQMSQLAAISKKRQDAIHELTQEVSTHMNHAQSITSEAFSRYGPESATYTDLQNMVSFIQDIWRTLSSVSKQMQHDNDLVNMGIRVGGATDGEGSVDAILRELPTNLHDCYDHGWLPNSIMRKVWHDAKKEHKCLDRTHDLNKLSQGVWLNRIYAAKAEKLVNSSRQPKVDNSVRTALRQNQDRNKGIPWISEAESLAARSGSAGQACLYYLDGKDPLTGAHYKSPWPDKEILQPPSASSNNK